MSNYLNEQLKSQYKSKSICWRQEKEKLISTLKPQTQSAQKPKRKSRSKLMESVTKEESKTVDGWLQSMIEKFQKNKDHKVDIPNEMAESIVQNFNELKLQKNPKSKSVEVLHTDSERRTNIQAKFNSIKDMLDQPSPKASNTNLLAQLQEKINGLNFAKKPTPEAVTEYSKEDTQSDEIEQPPQDTIKLRSFFQTQPKLIETGCQSEMLSPILKSKVMDSACQSDIPDSLPQSPKQPTIRNHHFQQIVSVYQSEDEQSLLKRNRSLEIKEWIDKALSRTQSKEHINDRIAKLKVVKQSCDVAIQVETQEPQVPKLEISQVATNYEKWYQKLQSQKKAQKSDRYRSQPESSLDEDHQSVKNLHNSRKLNNDFCKEEDQASQTFKSQSPVEQFSSADDQPKLYIHPYMDVSIKQPTEIPLQYSEDTPNLYMLTSNTQMMPAEKEFVPQTYQVCDIKDLNQSSFEQWLLTKSNLHTNNVINMNCESQYIKQKQTTEKKFNESDSDEEILQIKRKHKENSHSQGATLLFRKLASMIRFNQVKSLFKLREARINRRKEGADIIIKNITKAQTGFLKQFITLLMQKSILRDLNTNKQVDRIRQSSYYQKLSSQKAKTTKEILHDISTPVQEINDRIKVNFVQELGLESPCQKDTEHAEFHDFSPLAEPMEFQEVSVIKRPRKSLHQEDNLQILTNHIAIQKARIGKKFQQIHYKKVPSTHKENKFYH